MRAQRNTSRRIAIALGAVLIVASCRTASAPEPVATAVASTPTPEPTVTLPEASGFGARTRGGADGAVITIESATTATLREAFSRARAGNVTVQLPANAKVVLDKMLPHLTGANVTIEGNGATIDGSRLEQKVALIDIRGHDVVVRDLRLRNGYDNLRIQGPEAFNVVVDHVSSTGAADDGIAITHGAHDVTVQHVYLAGNTRGFFSKYDGTRNISLHHSLFQKNWVRSPLFSGTTGVDVRNVIVEEWGLWGSRFERGASGNLVASLFSLSPYAKTVGGKGEAALDLGDPAKVHTAGNVFRDGATETRGTAPAPFEAPPVPTLDVAAMEASVRAEAGCQPRDDVDRAYLGLKVGWKVGESEPFRVRMERR